jgi:DNA modification methylase
VGDVELDGAHAVDDVRELRARDPEPAHAPARRTRLGGVAVSVEWIHESLRSLAVPIDSVREDAKNARRHGKRNLDAIQQLLERCGQLRPLVVDEDGVILAGNGTHRVAKRMGRTMIAVLKWSASEETKRFFAVGDNRSAELAEWDPDALAESFRLIQASLPNVADVAGFNVDEIQHLLEQSRVGTGTGVEEDDAPERPEVPITRPGDIWTFPTGHRIMCGDATNPDHYDALLQGVKADLVHTDPPYGVAYTSGDHAPIRNDALAGDALADFLTRAFRNAARHALPKAAWYVWYATETRREFELALQRVGVRERQQVLWVKPSHTLGRSDYQWQHEPCFYAARDGETPAFHGERAESTVWILASAEASQRAIAVGSGVVVSDGQASLYVTSRAPKGKKPRTIRLEPGTRIILTGDDDASDVWQVAREANPLHPTQKPVAIPARAIRNSTLPGGVVLDPFLGSGSTLLAAEQLGRRCYGLDLDAAYIDVVIRRYVRLTGRAPTNQHGEPWTGGA